MQEDQNGIASPEDIACATVSKVREFKSRVAQMDRRLVTKHADPEFEAAVSIAAKSLMTVTSGNPIEANIEAQKALDMLAECQSIARSKNAK